MGDILKKQLEWYKLNRLVARPSQVKAAELIAKNWSKRYHIVSAPTGVGKQFIAMAAAYAAGNSFILTHTKQLQDQYINGEGDIEDLRGRGNYKCGINPTMTAADAPCTTFKHIIKKCAMRGICPYINQKKKALASRNIVTNYTYFLFSRLCGPFAEIDPRSLLIADEAHILENQLINFAEFKLDPEELQAEYDVYDMSWIFVGSDEENVKIVESIYQALSDKKLEYERSVETIYLDNGISTDSSDRDIAALPDKVKKKVKDLIYKSDKIDKIYKKIGIYVGTCEEYRWIISSKENVLTVTPLKAEGLFGPLCDAGAAHKFLFMSATIGDPKEFSKELGISMSDCNYVEVDTTFDEEDSPIIHISVGKFNYTEIDNTLPKALKVIDSLLNEHKDDKGIIHSTNYKITEYIAKRSLHAHRLLHRNINRYPVKNNVLLEKHEQSKKPTVLLSPSMGTGISLDDDLARFQIIIKLPFLSLGDPRVKAKMKISNTWYRNKMWQEIMQASGRATRSDDDYCLTYILDESMEYFYRLDKNNLPNWFKDRLIF